MKQKGTIELQNKVSSVFNIKFDRQAKGFLYSCVNVSKMKTRIGLSFFLCLVVVTVVLVKAQDDATEISEIVDTNVDVLNSDIAQIEDVIDEENEVKTLDNDDDYEETAPVEETPSPEIEEPAVQVEDEIIEDNPVESIKEAESVEEISTNDETETGEAPKPVPKSRSGNYQYDEFFGNLDTFNTDGGFNGGGDPNYNYGKSLRSAKISHA